jgi:hypothetical protein
MVYWGENIARGKSNHIFLVGHNFFCDSICVFQLGENIGYFFPLCLYLLGYAINCSTFTGGVLGEIFFPSVSMFFPIAMLYGIHFTFLLGYEFKEKQYNIFPPSPVFFLLVTEKFVKKLMGERKMVFFPFPYFSPLDHAVFGSPSKTVTVLRCMKMMSFTLGLNVHSSACKLQ